MTRNRNRAAGDRFEYRVRDTFVARGWWVFRAAGSLGIADLVALKRGQPPVLISCKVNGRIDPAERVRLWAISSACGGEGLVCYRERPGWVAVDRVTVSGTREAVGSWHMPAETPKPPAYPPEPYPETDP
jgi:Holliday junction resolvase